MLCGHLSLIVVGVQLAEPEISVAGGSSLSTLWRRVMIGLPSNNDLENIMKAWYPSLGPLTGRLIGGMHEMLRDFHFQIMDHLQ